MAKTRKEKERAQKLWEERRELLRFGYGKIAEFIVREARQKYQQAMQARLKGDLRTAKTMLREVVEKVPDAPDPLLALGQLLLETGRAEEAIGFLSKACEVDNMNPQSHFLFGQALEASGRLRRAKEAYERALQRYPTGDLAKEIEQRLRALEESWFLKPPLPCRRNKRKIWRKTCTGRNFTLRLVSREGRESIWNRLRQLPLTIRWCKRFLKPLNKRSTLEDSFTLRRAPSERVGLSLDQG